jgi:predicted enzyme related to lactoylglutathione lyase
MKAGRSFRVPVFLSPLAIPIAWLAYAQDPAGNVFGVLEPGSAMT